MLGTAEIGCQQFRTAPRGYPKIELKPGGAGITVTGRIAASV